MLKAFNKAMDYIEDHLTENIESQKIAQIALVSDYHFRRMFSYLTGLSLSEYIRKRRLSEAANALLAGTSVTEAAFLYGYDSLEGFSRAFKEWSGRTPKSVQEGKFVPTFSKINFQMTMTGGKSMEVKIVEKPAFKLIGVQKRVKQQYEGVNQEILDFTHTITEEQRKKMRALGDLFPKMPLNISYEADETHLTHMIGFASTQDNIFEDLVQIEVPENLWAIFSSKGVFPNDFQATWKEIFSQWIPSSDYELVDLPQISFTDWLSEGEEKYSEIWLPLKKNRNLDF
ncbi:AraC family transcriptional regulator [Lactococcus garvieae]|uniref:Transcriptional regulator, AraC family n=1 Tax=Lactococcus garvieae DCC43 TaxID=1231377 RepID=K2NUJ6_9LACT|nr:AraC family transcriptional regulator [Lactococcus garvieae]EKF51198.1 Transcriptional regulator, AraC family [Lactococcus garvieae DCC43]